MNGDEQRILILDGATGTMIQRYAPSTDGNNDWLNISDPELIARIHREYIEAGADIIETNTFNSNRISQHSYGLSGRAPEMAFEGARIARKEADRYNSLNTGRHVLVAGSIGPTSKSLSLSPDVNDPAARDCTFEEMSEAYGEEIGALVKGGADMILFETCFDALNVKAGLYALCRMFPKKDIPVMISVSVGDRSGRTLTGQTLQAFYTAVRHYPLYSFGLNCSLGAAGMIPLIRDVASWAGCAVSCYPNAGLPNELGGYDEQPGTMAEDMRKMAAAGLLNIAGGCCGTTPEHIRAIAAALKDCPARRIPDADRVLTVSGLETVRIDTASTNFTNIGERTNVAGSRKFARLIAGGEMEEAMEIAAGQVSGGASIIDINMDDAMLDSTREMTRFTRHISNDPNVAKAALMIDSSHWETLKAGLMNAQGKCIVNSISLKEGEEAFLEKAREIHALGAAMVVMAFDEEGQATDFQRKIGICDRAYRLLTGKAGIPPEDIIFDVNVLSIATGIEAHARYGLDFIEAVRWIKGNLPGALTSGGISNLSFAFRGNNKVREAMHSVFLFHAIAAGLDMGIVNPGMLMVHDDIEPDLRTAIEDVLFDRHPQATEHLIAMAQSLSREKEGPTSAPVTAGTETGTPAEQVRNALVRGVQTGLEPAVLALLQEEGSAVQVIEGPLMEAMETVGRLFGEGKMFLPQVVKSAKIMKEAVSILEPYMEEDGSTHRSGRPRIVIATVKGDVHDIGKNITSIVLTCNGFDVTDLGVMVDGGTLLDKARETGADIVAVSGLITPSLFQMEEICKEMTARKMDIPLFVGGATTSALHTAVKLAPLYGKVFHGADASACAVMAKHYMTDPRKFLREQLASQEKLRQLHAQAQGRPVTDDGARQHFPDGDFLLPEDLKLWSVPAGEVPLGEITAHFDWKLFHLICGIREHDSDIAREVDGQARRMMGELARDPGFRFMQAVEFFEAWQEQEGIIHLEKGEVSFDLPMLREGLSLADFVPSSGSGNRSVCGLFTITVQRGREEDLVSQAVLDTLAEAASARLDRIVLENVVGTGWKMIRPAAGYPCLPDHSIKKDIIGHLPDNGKLGIFLTESYGMRPDASVCGMIFLHRQASYPDIRTITPAQYEWYRKVRGWDENTGRMMLGHLLKER